MLLSGLNIFLNKYYSLFINGQTIFSVIDRIPPIDSSSTAGLRPNKAEGRISFDKVHFTYPSRPDVKILQGISFTVEPGQTVALVGTSGCGN